MCIYTFVLYIIYVSNICPLCPFNHPGTSEKKSAPCHKTIQFGREIWAHLSSQYPATKAKSLKLYIRQVMEKHIGGRSHIDHLEFACFKSIV